MKYFVLVFISILLFTYVDAQTPKSYSSADILQQLKKLEIFGSVLYIAAHPDDENTRLMAYLSNERKFRTGYMSLTRGDGGQNLIGDEQGIDLGLIRTQELLAARRIDGAEQFFSRAFDFGYSKSPDETIQTWGHDKILSDVVWVIRNFKPDVIITRFPTTGEGGHGHHTASAILAGEAFDAAADATKFPEQLQNGVTVWKTKRLLWNTFNFGGNNTQREDQLKIDVGMYNPILGKSYGEMAAESRSQHKSQGFGVASQRGETFEYFSTIKGEKPQHDFMDGIDISDKRLAISPYANTVQSLIKQYDYADPSLSLQELTSIFKLLLSSPQTFWRDQKLNTLLQLIEACSGIFMEATTNSAYAVQGDSLKVSVVINNRNGLNITNTEVQYGQSDYTFPAIEKNKNSSNVLSFLIPANAKLTQPYWLEKEMNHGSFNVTDQQLIGLAQNDDESVIFSFEMYGAKLKFRKPLRYKYTDPVKGELFQPLTIVPAATIKAEPATILHRANQKKTYQVSVKALTDISLNKAALTVSNKDQNYVASAVSNIELSQLKKGEEKVFAINSFNGNTDGIIKTALTTNSGSYGKELVEIKYDHIPTISYFKDAEIKVVQADVKIAGSRVGYIVGAGDKVPQALEQMGYAVVMLAEKDINFDNIKSLDAIVTGVRAHNTNAWLSNVYDVLMQYVNAGGVLLVQYNTNNSIGPVKARISPYPFDISRNRITDETAKVNFLLPNHPALNFPNKITSNDFDGWIQERSVYNADNIDAKYQRILSMKDPGEKEQDGSLIIADYGKGRFIYTGLVFFRELPAGIPGAYRLFANLIANRNNKK